jgi:hypothetical protein
MAIPRLPRSACFGIAVALVVASTAGAMASPRETRDRASTSQMTVRATREQLTSDAGSVVAGDNEVMALAAQSGRLFAATDQWMSPAPAPHGQVLVKDRSSSAWRVFEDTESVRVEALASFPIPRDQQQQAGHSVLVTQAIVGGVSQIQWLRDQADRFQGSFALSSRGAAVRAFGAHESGGTWAIYAGVDPTGVLRGTWSPARRTFLFDPVPELQAAAPGALGDKSRKVTGFADCGGALYVSIKTTLYRRNDGPLPSGAPRWSPVYQAPPVGQFNSGLRGLTCVRHRSAPALVVSTEGNGDVLRFDDLPRGDLHSTTTLTAVREFAPIPTIARMLATEGTTVPPTGTTSIDYVIAAYNDFATVDIAGVTRQLVGFEWGYLGDCPATRVCGPRSFGGAANFDATACFFIRTDVAGRVTYAPRCLGGTDMTPSPPVGNPIRSGQAFVSIRTVRASPFGDGRTYFGGYDCNFYPADGTAWLASTTSHELVRTVTRGGAP